MNPKNPTPSGRPAPTEGSRTSESNPGVVRESDVRDAHHSASDRATEQVRRGEQVSADNPKQRSPKQENL